jgi:hypothetical protein
MKRKQGDERDDREPRIRRGSAERAAVLGKRWQLRDLAEIELLTRGSASTELWHVPLVVRVGTTTKLVEISGFVAVAVLLVLVCGDERRTQRAGNFSLHAPALHVLTELGRDRVVSPFDGCVAERAFGITPELVDLVDDGWERLGRRSEPGRRQNRQRKRQSKK